MNQSLNIRKTLGLTQKELAGILNISCKLLSQYEKENAVLPLQPNNDLKRLHGYMKLALSIKGDLKTMADCVAQQKTVAQLLQENKKQRDQITVQLKTAVLKSKDELAKKKMLWLLAKDKKDHRFFSYQKLDDCLQKPTDFTQTDVMIYKIKLNTLNFEKARLEEQWRVLLSNIEYLESYPD